jgi:hypothetical protein
MQKLDKTAWEVLNATADDCENLEQIYRQVCLEFSSADYDRGVFCYRPAEGTPLLSEVADRIRQLVKCGLLTVVVDEDGLPWKDLDDATLVWRGWFQMTAQGRKVWESSEYASTV